MQRDVLVRRVFGGGVHATGDVAARGGAELVVEQRVAEAGGEFAEALRRADLEAAKENAGAHRQALRHQWAQLGQGIEQVDAVAAGLHQ